MNIKKIWCKLGFHDYVVIGEGIEYADILRPEFGVGFNIIEDRICICCAKKQLDLTNYHKWRKDYADHKIQRTKIAKQLAKNGG